MTEPESADGPAEQAFAAAETALDAAVAAVRRLARLAGLGDPARSYLGHCSFRLAEAQQRLAIARTCAKALQASRQDAAQEQQQQGDLFKPVAQDAA